MTKKRDLKPITPVADILPEIRSLIESSRYRVAAAANLEMVSLHWNIGRIITQKIQREPARGGYASALIEAVASDLTQYGRGFSISNLWDMKRFFDTFEILQTLSGVSSQKRLQTVSGVSRRSNKIPQTVSGEFSGRIEISFSKHHHIGWSHYVQLMGESDPRRRHFYFDQAANQRWSTRELRRQMQSALFERVALSKNTRKLIELEKKTPREVIQYEHAFKDPYVLDLLFYHRGLRCLVAIDLKIGPFTAADKGQMDLYPSWLKAHEWRQDENEPVGLILCTSKKKQHVELLLAQGPHKMQVAEYLTKLPDKKVLKERLRIYSTLLTHETH